MSEKPIHVAIKVRQAFGRQLTVELILDDPGVVNAIIDHSAGRSGGQKWEDVRQYLMIASENALIGWAQREHPETGDSDE